MRQSRVLSVLSLILISSFAEAQQADPAAYANYGAQLASQGQCAQALQYLEYAAAQNGSLPGVWARIGYCKESTGAKDGAIEAYRKALAADPNDSYSKKRLEALVPSPAAEAATPAPASATPAAGGGEAEEAPKPKAHSKSYKKFHVFLGGGVASLMAPTGASDLFGTGYVGDLRFIYHSNSSLGFLLDLSAEAHAHVIADESLAGGGYQTSGAAALAVVQTGLGARYVIGGLAGKSLAPYVEGELVFTSAAAAAVATTVYDAYGTQISTDSGVAVTASGVGGGLAGGIALGKNFGGFLELGFRASGVQSLSMLRFLAGLKF